MKQVVDIDRFKKTELIRDDSDESGRYFFHTTYFDDGHLQRNKRIRLEGLMPRHKKLPLQEGSTAAYAFSIPSSQWSLLRRDFPDIVAGLESRDVEENMKAARRLLILHPEWGTMEGNW